MGNFFFFPFSLKSFFVCRATWAWDQVSCGMISTYTNKSKFRKSIVRAFRQATDEGADVIVCELGGDLIWANNETLLSIEEITSNMVCLPVLINDALSGIGIELWLRQEMKFDMSLVSLFASPFRNFQGIKKRLDALLPNVTVLDPNSLKHIAELCDGSLKRFVKIFEKTIGANDEEIK